ncbi:MAG TPA: energy transducer TonB [Allosphingosinicella sp.]|jgi:protein TonB
MGRIIEGSRRERIGSTIAVAALHAALGYLLLAGFAITVPIASDPVIKLFDVAPPPLPPPEGKPVPAPAKPAAREGAASPANLKARPSPVVPPPPRIRLDPPPTLPAATAPADGPQAAAGASDRPGEGSGGGGSGAGSGSGRSGPGRGGGGGVATGARLVAGRITDSDYPRSASRSGATGTVVVHLSVGLDGRVSACRLARSSGSADLDEATCRLARERFRYSPARDSQGRAVADTVGWKQIWWQEGGGR